MTGLAGFSLSRPVGRPLARVLCGALLGWSLLGALPVDAAPLDRDPSIADPVGRLDEGQRLAARALGQAHRAMESGAIEEARGWLAKVQDAPALKGYVELVRMRLLMREGDPRAAHRLAGQALESAPSEALRAALQVLQGEALALAGDVRGAELAWNEVLGGEEARDESVRDSIQVAIVESRQRSGSLDPQLDPRVLLDRTFEDVTVTTAEIPTGILPAPVLLEKADAALSSGRATRAIDLYDEALAGELDEAARLHARLQRAHALFRSRRYESAAARFAELLPDVGARFWGARSRARAGDIEGALGEFERVAQSSDEALASWALYLMGTLFEDRGELDRAIASYAGAARFEGSPERSRDALWREGWARYRSGARAEARAVFRALIARMEDPLDQLRPRYWAARAALESGAAEQGRRELDRLAREFPLTYYGWRAQERLALDRTELIVSRRELAEGTRRVEEASIERAAMLIEAGLEALARDELRFAARQALGFEDRTQVGVLLARVGDYHRASRLVVIAYADSLARGLQPGRETLWWLSWPPAYREVLEEVFPADAAIDRELVWAIMREESHYRADARSAVGALGLLQLMPSTAAQLARERGIDAFQETDLFDPRTNISLGAAYLSDLAARFDGRISAAIGSYNAGPTRVASWLRGDAARWEDDVWVEAIPYDQTRSYVKRVLRSLHVYKTFYR